MLLVLSLVQIPSVFALGNEVQVEFFDNNGQTVTELSANSLIKAKVTFQDAIYNTLILAVYRNDELIDIDTENTLDFYCSMTAEITTPSVIDDCSVRAYLWNSLSDMRPVENAVLFANSNKTLESLSINGTEIALQSSVTDYSYQAVANVFSPFEVDAKTTDISSKVTVVQPTTLPGNLIVTVTAADGSYQDYTIEVTKASPSLSLIHKESTNNYNIIPNVANGAYTFSDRAHTLTDIEPFIGGATYIQTAVNDRAITPTTWTEKWIEIEIDSSAEVYVLSRPLPADNIMRWLRSSEWSQVQSEGQPVKLASWTGEWNDLFYLYKRTILLEPGSTQKVVFGGSGDTNSMYSIAVKWLDNSNLLKEIKINGVERSNFGSSNSGCSIALPVGTTEITSVEGTAFDSNADVSYTLPQTLPGNVVVTVTPPVGDEKIYTFPCTIEKTAVLTSRPSTNLYSTLVLGDNTPVFTDRYDWKFVNIAGMEYEGATFFQLSNSDSGISLNRSATTTNWVTWLELELNNPGYVYVFTEAIPTSTTVPWLISEGFTKTLNPDSTDFLQIANGNSGTAACWFRVWTKKVDVEAGKVERVRLGGLGQYNKMYAVAVKSTDASNMISGLKVNGMDVTAFSPDGSGCPIELPYGATSITNVQYNKYLDDATVSYDAPQSLPGDLTITVTPTTGIAKTYTFPCTVAQTPSAKITYKGSSSNYVILDSVAEGNLVFSDRSFTLEGITGSVIDGATYIQTANDDKYYSDNLNPANDKWFEVELNSSADVYVVTRSKSYYPVMRWLEESGWTQVKNPNGSDAIIKAWNPSGGYYEGKMYLYKKTVNIAAGEAAKVSFGSMGKYSLMYSAAIQWLE